MRVRYTLRAQADLDAIYTYLDARAPVAAQSVKTLIERRIAMLAEFPHIAPETDQPGVYELTIVRYPYCVYYEISGDEIWIVHIRDARRRPWSDESQ
jgi:plasmid stabilization system protein ParE